MRNTAKAATLESKFPLLTVEHDYILSKDADLSVAYRIELPELFTVTSAEYEAMHSAWLKAIKVLPNYCVVHRQDWFVEEKYRPELDKEDISFLSRSFERHFNERPYLNHTSYLFLTKTTKERARQQSNFNALTRGFIVPKEMQDKEAIQKFTEAVGQFERIINDSGFIKLTRITTDEIVGTDSGAGIVEKYFSLSQQDTTCLQDITLKAGEMKIGDKYLCLHTLSDTEDLPGKVQTDTRYERLSTDRSDCRLSFAAPIGVLLSCNHIVNQYIFIDDHTESLKRFEKQARNMHSLSRYSRSNQINKAWIEDYLNDAHSFGLTSVRCHVNVMAWSDDREDLARIKNDVGSQLALMECKPRHNTVDTPTLFWAGIPGNAGDFPSEESFYTFIEQALCFLIEETNYKNSPSPFGIKMVDRVTGRPLHMDISDLPMKKGIITNRNKFVLGPSGSGKSFFMNHLVRQYWEQGTHVVLVDTGNSYQGLCEMIRSKTKGEDGIYFTYTEENPISFNPFYTDDNQFDVEKKDSLKTLLLTLWKSEDDKITKTESGELGSAVEEYIKRIQSDKSIAPCFNTFYEFMRDEYKVELQSREIEVGKEEFNINNFLTTLRQYYKGGRFDFLLNSDKELDLLNKRFIVFEIDQIKENRDLFPIVTIIIMEAFINKMRRLKGIRKQFICEEAWKALSSPNMADYLKYLYKTVRKFFGEAIVVTQEVDDIISSPVVKDAIINNSDCKILLDQRKYMNKFDAIQSLLGLTDKERAQILSINMSNNPSRLYKEVWIGLGSAQSAVYATEVSKSEYLTYTTEETEKLEVMRLAEKLGGDMEQAIKQLAAP
ncbi:conjugation system TraG family ATPase [Dysgonomonas sp. PFB1-18]|uniref:TraG family conjugative transposon ATPase n=1 Tax=unclassified Dysgonomonas TaxID=2630389 RepID=UPI0013D72669|nr:MULTISPECIES: TraG family conjugative transposon ATPase [unclassified Dysgonomonas]MDH6310010.1 conjugation system TraG family ATPase [Dysgonomonas sp. PF1-14]MDH6339919.1 conjugation system TraG family ATPase [Dysgonomonas sp. PF1-16]MDH6381567.1 conjugation system TraG family ATPase [Dysgonomonas sp. PFB1-18]MDH6398796.1 conjugation system TraG family ATPase [Dysgonomonas sp. PF1-23]NDV93640.1 TraG family conjugative transposon ATPase [Dysgonomonas sp. 521]